jgi:hypothetical protein
VLQDLGIEVHSLSPLQDDNNNLNETNDLVERILRDNCEVPSLQALRKQAKRDDTDFTMEDGLLFYYGRLVVPGGQLYTDLIRKAYDQVSTVYPGKDKTYKLLRPQYYWKNM